ncbi:DNA-binding NarL/FixJ family response regulator [Streptosporangium becharense]|uniref:DNA-binding NarL/FixJ family response regulator n=1 Tax=Streptosporangium becharense TaxID=1816182 RepID=A0A7W9ILF4_9ACTN|nr:response regulator transcription factor [Streptosporangium becharense]MBB2911696.1 DNA-binding NarL/FixJ family response regulator [Streptosporangium becharense]MBB5822486.1 DNA-binding NarL/FixJ family response regulator [Streptosporangium becharense]
MTKARNPFPAPPSSRRPGDNGSQRSELSVFWLAEDDISYHGLPPLLMKVPNVGRAAVGQNAAEARALLEEEDFDLAVIPLTALPEIMGGGPLRAFPKTLATIREQDVEVVSSLGRRYGVDGYLLRDEINVVGLSDAFEQVFRGDVPAPSGVARGPVTGAGDASGPAAHPIRRLTERERTVLALLRRGMSNHQIARAMGITIHGVKRHVSNLLVKFDCSNRTEVALVAERLGMDSPSRSRRAVRRVT